MTAIGKATTQVEASKPKAQDTSSFTVEAVAAKVQLVQNVRTTGLFPVFTCPSSEEDFKIDGLAYKHYLKTLQFPGRLYFDRHGKEGEHTKTMEK
jgi:hypothetical protein